MIERLEMQLGDLAARFRAAYPALEVRRWSYPVAQLTVDGWSLGFSILGLTAPIEFELTLVGAHSKPVLNRAQAGWVGLGHEMEFRIVDLKSLAELQTFDPELDEPNSQGLVRVRVIAPKPVPLESLLPKTGDELLHELDKAVRTGPVAQPMMSMTVEIEGEESEVVPLSADEGAVLQAWFRHLRAQGFARLQATPSCHPGQFHLASPAQSRRVAAQLEGWIPAPEALVAALVGPLWSMEPSAQLDGEANWSWYDWRQWREYYRKNPRASGCMSIYRPGLSQDQAILIVENQVGLWDERPTTGIATSRLGCGTHLASLRRLGQGWKVQGLYRLPHLWTYFAYLEVALHIHFDGRLKVLARESGRLHLLYQGKEMQLIDYEHFAGQRAPFSCAQPCAVVRTMQPEEAILALTKILESLDAA